MARLLIGAIHAYQRLARRFRRRSGCLFAVSCSTHVEHEAAEHGFGAGVAAIRYRMATCRPGYSFVIDGRDWSIECRDGTLVASEHLSRVIHDEYESVASRLQQPLGHQLQAAG